MPNPLVSEIQSKSGDVFDIAAKRFSGNRTVTMTGDVTGSESGWNGSGALSVATTITNNAVTTQKIADKAVTTGKIDDGAVGLTQIASAAMTDTVESNNSKLVTSQGVNAAIAAAVEGRGKDYGPMSVDQINAITDTIPTGSTVHVESLGSGDARVISDGYSNGSMASFSVDVGEDLKYYRSGNTHGWYSIDGNFKLKQGAAYSGGIAVDTAQDATAGTDGLTFVKSFKQDTNGDIVQVKTASVQDGTTSQKGVVQLLDSHTSTDTDKAATPKNVKEAYDLADGKVSGPSSSTADDIAVYNGTTGKLLKDGGKKISDLAAANSVVAIADALVDRNGSDGWFKVASRTFSQTGVSVICSWLVTACGYVDSPDATSFIATVRMGFGSSMSITKFDSSPLSESNALLCDMKIVLNGSSGNATIELWVKVGSRYGSISVRELEASNFRGTKTKNFFTYTSYAPSDSGSSDEPNGDSNKKITFVYAKRKQTAVNDPTASGTALSFIDSITQNENGEITPTKKSVTVDATPTANSDNPVSSGGVRSELDSKPFIYVSRRNTDADDAFDSNEGNRFRVIEYTNAASNLPTSAFYHIYSSVGPDRSYQVQLALGMTSQDCYFRRKRLIDGTATWSDWKKFIFESDLTSALNNKQDLLPTSGTASDTYAINITGNAATATKPKYTLLTSSEDLNNIKGSDRGDILEYVWLNTSIPSNVPVSGSSGILLVVHKGSAQYTKQICFVPGTNKIWCRYQSNGSWGTWVQFLETGDVTSTYSSTGSSPVNGAAIAAALATLDAEKTSSDGTNVQVKVTEVDGKITAVNITTDNTASKVSNATNGNFAGLDANGNLTDSGSKASDFATAAQGTAADSAVQDVKIGNSSIVSNHVATIPSAATGTKGVVEYMTSQEAASLWTNAWAAAT